MPISTSGPAPCFTRKCPTRFAREFNSRYVTRWSPTTSAIASGVVSAWRATGIDDTAGREKLFLAINVVGKVLDHLASTIANGKLAQAELNELAQAAERRKRFGIL